MRSAWPSGSRGETSERGTFDVKTPSDRLPYLDVLRGVAILTVFVHHLPPAFGEVFGSLQRMGGRGVDLFFVLSGFLIASTCLARAEKGASTLRQTGAYWVLRTLRIWPLYGTMLLVVAIGVKGIDTQATQIVRDWPGYYLFFLSNDLAQATLELGVLWSLAIEEQFYLAVGLVLPFAAKNRERLATAFVGMAVVAILVSLRARVDLVQLRASHVFEDPLFIYRTYHSTLARLDQLALGVLAAVAALWFNERPFATNRRNALGSTWVVLAATVAALTFAPQFGPLEFLVIGVCFALAVLWLQRPAARGLDAPRPVQWLVRLVGWVGQLSFGLYLVHPYVRHLLLALMKRSELTFTSRTAAIFLFVWTVLSVIVAAIVYRWFETPFLTLARRWSRRILSGPEASKGAMT